jgi:hypothetical protein
VILGLRAIGRNCVTCATGETFKKDRVGKVAFLANAGSGFCSRRLGEVPECRRRVASQGAWVPHIFATRDSALAWFVQQSLLVECALNGRCWGGLVTRSGLRLDSKRCRRPLFWPFQTRSGEAALETALIVK